MQDATEHLLQLARRIMDAALERGPLRAAILLGQAATATPTSIRTLTCFYVDELPSEEHHQGEVRLRLWLRRSRLVALGCPPETASRILI
jgi:hypothetical protein